MRSITTALNNRDSPPGNSLGRSERKRLPLRCTRTGAVPCPITYRLSTSSPLDYDRAHQLENVYVALLGRDSIASGLAESQTILYENATIDRDRVPSPSKL